MDNIVSLLEMNPVIAVVGIIIFVLFFSNTLNLFDVNLIERTLMNSKQKFHAWFLKFGYVFMISFSDMLFLGTTTTTISFIPASESIFGLFISIISNNAYFFNHI